ncbi:MAG: Hpt domain-containing protein, partial [Burkholderiales bacterium]|nr:Hpt domain-containing protein [Burkholderiales bacterium]
ASRAADVARLREALAAGDAATARALAHNLKGVAATMGATELAARAARLESLVRGGEDGTRAVEEVAAAFAELAAATPAAPPAPAAAPPADASASAALLDELAALLEHSDAGAISLLERNDAGLRAALGAAHEAFASHVQHFEFDEALAILRGLRP